jgi:hypothetical protein
MPSVIGAIRDKWLALGGESSFLGQPETSLPGLGTLRKGALVSSWLRPYSQVMELLTRFTLDSFLLDTPFSFWVCIVNLPKSKFEGDSRTSLASKVL